MSLLFLGIGENSLLPLGLGGSSTVTAPTIGDLPLYLLTWTGERLIALGGDGPLRWELTRDDGQDVESPETASVVVTDDSGVTVATLTPTVESGAPEAMQVIGVRYAFAEAGMYRAILTLMMPDGALKSHSVIVFVQ